MNKLIKKQKLLVPLRLSTCALVTCALVLLLSGCAVNKYTKTIDQICPPAISRTDAMTAAEDVLANMNFEIEKFDVNSGYIRTAPLSGAQTIEFWRSDNAGSFNQAEADLQSLRRIVVLNITEQAGQLCINCTATTQRLSVPQGSVDVEQGRPVMSSGQKSLQKTRYNLEHKSNISWTDLGRDNQLETEILTRIESHLSMANKQLSSTKKEANK